MKPIFNVVTATSAVALGEHVGAWEQLAANAIEPNVFYEPWMLMPALESFGGSADFIFVLLYVPDPTHPSGPPLLCGFFPLVRERRFGIPLRIHVLTLWKHLHCFLCTPLVRTGYAAQCIAAFFQWAASGAPRASLVEFSTIPGEGPFRRHLIDHFRVSRTQSFSRSSFTRAVLRRRCDADGYLKSALSGDNRRELRRRERKLSELGEIRYVDVESAAELQTRIEQFLECEAGGWKGGVGGALACSEAGRNWFACVVQEAFRRKKLQFLALLLDRRPVALRCSFLALPGSFYFKPAYDEKYSRFAPGVLLEVETIRRLHAQSEVQWMDSCTSPDNTLLNDLWLDRISIETIWVPTGRGPGELVAALAPLGQWLRKKLRGRS